MDEEDATLFVEDCRKGCQRQHLDNVSGLDCSRCAVPVCGQQESSRGGPGKTLSMDDNKAVAPPRLRSLWIFLVLFGVVGVASIILDTSALTLVSAAFGVFGIGYFLRYYMRTGRNIIEDATENRDG